MRTNPCDQGHEILGETRLLPMGGDGNDILCFQCFAKEMKFRRSRNEEDAREGRPELWAKVPKWEDLKVYAEPTVPYVNKITVGFVVQKYDTITRLCVEQEFTAGDEVTYEDLDGEQIDWCEVPDDLQGQLDTYHYCPFYMKQPIRKENQYSFAASGEGVEYQ